MKWLADRIMVHRAIALFDRVGRHLPGSGTIADIGSGTGHNAEEIRRNTTLSVREFDVADLHWVGPGPVIFAGGRVPVDDGAFDGLLLLFVLQYVDSPHALLSEVRRVSHGPVIVVQSIYRGWCWVCVSSCGDGWLCAWPLAWVFFRQWNVRCHHVATSLA